MGWKFDGRYLKNGSKTVANVSGDKIREGHGSKTILNIKDDKIREGHGSKTLYNLKNDDIREGHGSRKIADMDDVRKDIDGNGGITLAALWLYYVR